MHCRFHIHTKNEIHLKIHFCRFTVFRVVHQELEQGRSILSSRGVGRNQTHVSFPQKFSWPTRQPLHTVNPYAVLVIDKSNMYVLLQYCIVESHITVPY